MEQLIPLPGFVLVELTESEIAHIDLPDKPYSTKTSGVVVKTTNGSDDMFLGKKIYFASYKDDIKETIDDREFAFINVKDIVGYVESS